MEVFRWSILWSNYEETCHELEDGHWLSSNNASCEQGLNNQDNKSKKITKVIVAGLILACITILESVASSYAYAAHQTVDTSNDSLPVPEAYTDESLTAISEIETNTTSLPELPVIAQPGPQVVTPEELVAPEPVPNIDAVAPSFSAASVNQGSADTSNNNNENNSQPVISSVHSTGDTAKSTHSLQTPTASTAVNFQSLPEEAIPQARILTPASASPGPIAEAEISGETIAIVPGNEAIPQARVLSPASASPGPTAEETISRETTAIATENEVIETHFRSEASSSTDGPSITQSASNVTLPEEAVPVTTVLAPQFSLQPLQITTPIKGSEADESRQVESASINNTLNSGADIALDIDTLTGVTEPDSGNLIQNNSTLIFRSADENIAVTISPSDLPPQDILPIEPEPEPDVTPFELPPADELLEPSETPSQSPLPTEDIVFAINRFEFLNNTAFDDETLQQETAEFLGEQQTFADIAAAREAITRLYVDNGYATSGAIVPPQSVTAGQVQVEIIEGRLDDIVVQGNRRLRSGYISSRIAVGTEPPLNVNRLVERLQLLQSDPLVQSISADLQAGIEPGTNTLVVSVAEADSFGMTYTLDNNRSPSVGTVRHQLQASEGNLLGFGDRLTVDYTLTSGSDGIDVDYNIPLSPHGTSLRVAFNTSDNEVTEDPFDVLDIDSDTEAYELTLRHPLKQTPTQELAIGLTGSYQRTQTFLGFDDIGPFPLSPGADNEGRTKVSALRFFQEWTHRTPKQVLALRSQFNVGLDALDATVNDDAPDSRFFSWQGQAQWVNVLAPDTLLLLKGTAQLADDSLLTAEQLSLGGRSTVRGYRQNLLSTDSGVSASAELRFPIARERSSDTLLQLAPFVDAGYGWNVADSSPEPIVGAGLGLLFRQQEFSARLDWGIPLINADDDRDSLQESGVYFSMQYSFF